MKSRIHRRKKKSKKNKRCFFDVDKKRIISLKEKILKIEISLRDLKLFFQKRRAIIGAVTAILLCIFGISVYLTAVRADIAVFYPSVCFGGWEKSQNVQGKPDLGSDADENSFNLDNSAVLRNALSEIFWDLLSPV